MRYRRIDSAPDPAPIVDAGMLCELRVWTEAEWAALPAEVRPARYTHVPGLGWVGAVPLESLN
jgi:hypothetical protein